ncbi:hypothetical protein V501_03378 [Pseudogymnoascus sp. VKM F-4519 (FW-2642)]|nr:hypothetical protein V501_03378 [Pseudogymnoascus sp. VKM F-4519 (FW-2642)]
MPSSKHTKIKERQLLADRIKKNGIPMSPCSNCLRSDRDCIVAPGHRRCSECARRNSKCDACAPSPADWERLRKEEERLEAEEEAAAFQEREAHLRAQEAYARRMRLRKQQKALKTRGAEMLRRGLHSLDELEAAEERERVALAEANSLPTAPPTTSPEVFDPELDFSTFDHTALSPSYWDVGGGTPSATLGS